MKCRLLFTLIVVLVLFDPAAFAAEKPKLSARTAAAQLLTYASVVNYFKSAGLRTTEVQKRCTIFFEGEWKNADVYNYGLIIVENSDEDLQLTFYFTDAHEMNWATEFLDAPFFTKSETQKLFGLVNAHEPMQSANVGRYRVEFHHWEPKHAEIFVFSFTSVRPSRS